MMARQTKRLWTDEEKRSIGLVRRTRLEAGHGAGLRSQMRERDPFKYFKTFVRGSCQKNSA